MTATGIMSANEHNQQHLKRLHVFAHVPASVPRFCTDSLQCIARRHVLQGCNSAHSIIVIGD